MAGRTPPNSPPSAVSTKPNDDGTAGTEAVRNHRRAGAMSETVLILDFGSQVTQLIARRVRESGVYCEIHPCTRGAEAICRLDPAAVILSGGPASVTAVEGPTAPDEVFALGVPVLGICYGQQTMCAELGGAVEAADHRELLKILLAKEGHVGPDDPEELGDDGRHALEVPGDGPLVHTEQIGCERPILGPRDLAR